MDQAIRAAVSYAFFRGEDVGVQLFQGIAGQRYDDSVEAGSDFFGHIAPSLEMASRLRRFPSSGADVNQRAGAEWFLLVHPRSRAYRKLGISKTRGRIHAHARPISDDSHREE